jgi:hypothetical protein
MLRNILYAGISILCLAVIASLLVTKASPVNNRYEINGTAQTRGEIDQNHFTGNAELKINNENRVATVDVNVIGPYIISEPNNRTATISYRLVFENGDSMIASGRLNLHNAGPPHLHNINASLGVTEGTGVFANGRGQLVLQGNINVQTGDASWEIKGTIENQGGAQ